MASENLKQNSSPNILSFWQRLTQSRAMDTAVIVILIAALLMGIGYWRQQSEMKALENQIAESHADLDALHGAIATMIDKNAFRESREPMCETVKQELMAAISEKQESTEFTSAATHTRRVTAYNVLRQIFCLPVKEK